MKKKQEWRLVEVLDGERVIRATSSVYRYIVYLFAEFKSCGLDVNIEAVREGS